MKTAGGAVVQGEIVITPASPVADGLTTAFCLDDAVRLISDMNQPRMTLDTTTLEDGLYELRVDILDGTQLAFSTGSIPLHVANRGTGTVLQQTRTEVPFNKAYRKAIRREIVWYNNREMDLEKHGFIQRGRVYITLTDLMRHIGGNIIWGPHHNFIEVQRSGLTVRVIPGSTRIIVNGETRHLDMPARRIGDRTYVPVRPFCALFGITTHWSHENNRAIVFSGS